MTEIAGMGISRRTMFAGSLAVTAAATLPASVPAQASAPLANKQAPAWYRIKVGSSEVTVIAEGARLSPLPSLAHAHHYSCVALDHAGGVGVGPTAMYMAR